MNINNKYSEKYIKRTMTLTAFWVLLYKKDHPKASDNEIVDYIETNYSDIIKDAGKISGEKLQSRSLQSGQVLSRELMQWALTAAPIP